MENPMENKGFYIFKQVLRILLGTFFMVTAVFKLLSLDSFELYIYSFNIFNFVISSFVARCVIAAELLLGTLLIVKIRYRLVWWLTMVMLCGFTLLLVYVAIFRNDTNCHCLGDIVQLNPTLSIVKNIVTMLLLMIVRKEEEYVFRRKKLVGILVLVASMAIPFACFPMDVVYNAFSKSNLKVNEEKFNAFLQDSTAQALHLSQGNYVVAYFAAGCPYCKISATKLSTIVENNHLDTDRFVFFIWGKDDKIETFKEETKTQNFRFVDINPIESVQLVYGNFPTMVFLRNGKIEEVADVRSFDDKKVVRFLKK